MSVASSLVHEYIRQELARIMGVEPEGLETDQPLSTFGLDSLLALELKNNLEGRLDFTLPMAKLMEGPSITSLAAETVRLVVGDRLEIWRHAAAAHDRRCSRQLPNVGRRLWRFAPPALDRRCFFLPALGGDIRCYDDLVQRLGDDQPVYAFRPRGIDQDLAATSVDGRNDRRLRGRNPRVAAERSVSFGRLVDRRHFRLRAGRGPGARRRTGRPARAVRCAVTVYLDDVDPDDDAHFLCVLVNFANCFAARTPA